MHLYWAILNHIPQKVLQLQWGKCDSNLSFNINKSKDILNIVFNQRVTKTELLGSQNNPENMKNYSYSSHTCASPCMCASLRFCQISTSTPNSTSDPLYNFYYKYHFQHKLQNHHRLQTTSAYYYQHLTIITNIITISIITIIINNTTAKPSTRVTKLQQFPGELIIQFISNPHWSRDKIYILISSQNTNTHQDAYFKFHIHL